MNDEVDVKELVKAISPVYTPEYELQLFENIISALYHQGTDSITSEKVIIGVYNQLPSHKYELNNIIQVFDDIFGEVKKPNGGVEEIKQDIMVDKGKSTALKVANRINQAMIPYKKNTVFEVPLNDNSEIVMNGTQKEIAHQSWSFVRNKKVSTYSRVLLCYPIEVIIHDNPLSEEGRIFSIKWQTKHGNTFYTNEMTVSDIETYLTDHAYVLSPKHLKGVVAAIIRMATDSGMAVIKNDIETPGFYYNKKHDNLVVVDYDVTPVDLDGVRSSLKVIEDLKQFFEGHEDKLATTLKHSLISPFGFAKKQMGQPLELLIPYLYHFGKSGSGKTTIARIGLYFYGEPDSNTNDLGGTEFDTVPRIGEALSKSTFGVVVSEPENTFMCRRCCATLKTCVERTNSRKKFRGNRISNILALAVVQFASNDRLPNLEGLPRRFVQILYSHSEKKTKNEKEKFMSFFGLDTPSTCKFNELKHLSNWAIHEIQEDMSLLSLNWKEFGNALMMRAYADVGMECPEWLLEYTESVSDVDVDEEESEEIRMFLIDEINKSSKQIKVYDSETGYPVKETLDNDVKDSYDFRDRVFNVINEHLIPYMVLRYNRSNNKEEVCFTNGFKKALNNANINCYSIPSIAELLNWEYGNIRLNGKQTKCMFVELDKFLEFLYPLFGDFDDN